MDGEHVININELLISTTREYDSGWPAGGRSGEDETVGKPIIHGVNQHIRYKQPDNAFLPYFISIGPYNFGAPATHAMQKTKYEFLSYILSLKHEEGLPEFLEAMRELEKKVKGSYAEAITMENNDFFKMLLLDGCFIFICLRGLEACMPQLLESSEPNREIEADLNMNVDEDYSSNNDLLYSEWFRHDLLLLENQIPFFVIKTIHKQISGGTHTTVKLDENVVEFVESVLACYPKAICKSNRPKNFHHLLHLCHLYFKPCWEEGESNRCYLQPLHRNSFDETLPWRRALEYSQAGIKFKKRTTSEKPHSLLDIIFCNGAIEIPCLTVEPNTYSLFCNLIAFEQTCPQFGSFVTTYIMFLSCLISMPEDVSLLTERGIIVHQLNSDAEVSEIFRGISECIISGFDNDAYLQSLCIRLEEHYQSRRPILRAFLGTITLKVRRWTQKIELPDLPVSMPTGSSV